MCSFREILRSYVGPWMNVRRRGLWMIGLSGGREFRQAYSCETPACWIFNAPLSWCGATKVDRGRAGARAGRGCQRAFPLLALRGGLFYHVQQQSSDLGWHFRPELENHQRPHGGLQGRQPLLVARVAGV